MQLIRDFFIKHFTKSEIASEADYMFSALCASLSYRLGKFSFEGRTYGADGIIYASVAHGYQGINFAFPEATILSNKIKFISAEYQSVILSPINEKGNEHQVVLGRAECISEETGELSWELFINYA